MRQEAPNRQAGPTRSTHSWTTAAGDSEIVDRLDRIEHRLGRLVTGPAGVGVEPWISKRELARTLGVGVRWLDDRVAEGLPHRHIAGAHKFRLSAVEPWLKGRGLLEEFE